MQKPDRGNYGEPALPSTKTSAGRSCRPQRNHFLRAAGKVPYEALDGSSKERGAHAANEAIGNDNARSSERVVRRDAERGEKIDEAVMDLIDPGN